MDTALRIRRIIIEQSRRAHVGHIGSALSIADIIAVLYDGVLRLPGTDDPSRDRFILSKGHAVLALYAALYLKDIITKAQLDSYCGDKSLLGSHPEHQLRGIEFSTGSLGHGLSYGAGLALGARMGGASYRTFVLLSDAECEEGSVWEAVMFAAQNKLGNLVTIVDNNGQQAFGKTRDIIDLHPMGEKWRAFGWDVHEVNGHDCGELKSALKRLDTTAGPPHVIIANTVSGKGISFMEGEIKWHYLPMSEEQYNLALEELEARR